MSLSFKEATRRFQEDYWRRLVKEAGWNITKAAKTAKVNRTHLHKMLVNHGIYRPGLRRRIRGNWGSLTD